MIGFFLSTVLLWHATFLVNSAAHLIGRRRFATPDTSRNSAVIAFLTGGEGWHNNHHYLPASARQGFTRWEFDPTWYVLRALAALRLVRDLRDPPAQLVGQARVRDGAFDIGMFRSYWERAARVTGERIADLSTRPVAASAEAHGHEEEGLATGGGSLGRRGTTVPAVRPHRPCPRVGRSVGGVDPPYPEGDPGGPGGSRLHRHRRPMTAPAPAGGSAFASATLWIVDLDGVVWLSGRPIGDVGSAIDDLRRRGKRVVFATNNSAPTTARAGGPAQAAAACRPPPDDLASSAGAAASLLDPGQSVRVLAEGGVLEALAARGVKTVPGDGADAAVVGWSRSFDFDALAATAAVARRTGRSHRHQ